ncbi:MAG: T9SS type A sorting domain-containing protein [Bacteroidetes bacterium]|nr:T9SS type A sorting domain-containing protein [Bacteroidota bacterium]
MLKRATTLLMLLITPLLVGNAVAQQSVTIRQINAIPQDQINQLIAAGTSLTTATVTSGTCGGLLWANTLCGQSVKITAVVISDPLNSGLSSPNSTTGLPSRVHVFVRDVAADTEGPEGHGLQLVDGSNLGFQSLIRGDVIEVVGTVSPFNTTMQVAPTSMTVVGSRNPATDPIFNPILVTSADLNRSVGPDGAIQVNWSKVADYRGNYVKLVGATVLTRTASSGGRPDFNVSTDGGQTSVSMYDTSLRYRNDRAGKYPGYNPRAANNPFTPPPAGARVNLSGFMTMPGGTGSDPYSLGLPKGLLYAINPMADSDLVITESPPAITGFTRPAAVPGAGPVTLTATITPDPTRTITSASLVYFTSSNATPTTVASTGNTDNVYSFSIPGVANGDFITYWVRAVDNTNAVSESAQFPLRSLQNGITSISQIQQTSDGKQGNSPFFDMTVDMDITATVQNAYDESRLITLQDDFTGGPWTGIFSESSSSTSAFRTLKKGDVIRITRARIYERFGVTQIDPNNVTFTVISTGGFGIPAKSFTTSALKDLDIAEAHEGILLNIDNPLVVSTNADAPGGPFGEFLISSDGTVANGLRVDDASNGISYTGRDPGTVFSVGQRLDFVRGVLYFSFSNFKLLPATTADIGGVINTATEDAGIPARFTLDQNYPNPFNPSTQISFDVASTGHVQLDVFDVMGRQVATLLSNTVPVGTHSVTFDAQNLSSGIYIYRMTSGASIQTKRMLLMK